MHLDYALSSCVDTRELSVLSRQLKAPNLSFIAYLVRSSSDISNGEGL